MRSRDSLLFAAVCAVLGMGAGFLSASLLQGGRPAQASGSLAPMPRAAQPRASTDPAVEIRADLAGVERETAVAPIEAPVVPRLAEAELERALDSIAAPTLEPMQGAGTIHGEVLDETGMPLQRAVIVGTQNEAPRASDPETVGGAAPAETSLEDHLRESAKRWARTHGLSRRTVSGADGRFELTGLDEKASYSLSAFLEGHVLEPQGTAFAVSAGRRIDFRAEAVQRIPVRLVYENGGQPAEAVIGVKRGGTERLYAWTSAEPVLRLTPGRVALRGYAGVLRSEGGRGEVDSHHATKELGVEVADQAGAPVELVLGPRRGIRGRVIDAFGGNDGRQMVRLLALGSDGEVDLEDLAESRRYARLSGDRFHLLDLDPGLYAVGLSDWNNALITHQVVSVDAGVVEVALEVPEADPEQHLIVRAFGPTGRALRDLDFRWETRQSGAGSRSGGIQGRRDADGSYWLRPKADFFDAWGKESSYTLTVVHAQLGEREIALTEGQREVDVSYVEPVTLVVVVDGYAGSGYVGKLEVALAPVVEGESEAEAQSRMQRTRSRAGDPFSPEGVARFEGLAPGRWKLDLMVETGQWQKRSVHTVEVVATHGEQTVAMNLPALYDVVVVAPGLSEGTYLFLNRASGESSGAGFFDGNTHAQLGADGRAVFRGLAAGDYILRANGVSEPVDVTVPCGEVLLDSREPDCLRVAIGDMQGAMYQAGLRAGDLIVAVDGAELGSGQNIYESIMGEGSMDLTVLREGKTFAVTLQRIHMGSDWWSSLGGMLSPASRP
jgi:hypothetical protein